MPIGAEHRKFSKMRTGNEHSKIHNYIDHPHKWLGSVHRIERHDYKTLAFILEKYGEESFQEAFYHYMDDISSIND